MQERRASGILVQVGHDLDAALLDQILDTLTLRTVRVDQFGDVRVHVVEKVEERLFIALARPLHAGRGLVGGQFSANPQPPSQEKDSPWENRSVTNDSVGDAHSFKIKPDRMNPVSLGKLRLATPLLLSPLAGYTNLPFRQVIREIGGVGLCTTDLVNARSLLERNRKALKLIESLRGRCAACGADFRLRAVRDERRRADAGGLGRRLGRREHGLPGQEGRRRGPAGRP